MKEEILSLHEEGLTYRQIRDRLGCSLGTISYHCGKGQKEKTNLRLKERRNKKRIYISESKHMKPCMDCGEPYPAWVMDFDHVLGAKKACLATMANGPQWSLQDVIQEIEKCELVCANCHRQRTWNRLQVTDCKVMESEITGV